jgi:hypothetical protein
VNMAAVLGRIVAIPATWPRLRAGPAKAETPGRPGGLRPAAPIAGDGRVQMSSKSPMSLTSPMALAPGPAARIARPGRPARRAARVAMPGPAGRRTGPKLIGPELTGLARAGPERAGATDGAPP